MVNDIRLQNQVAISCNSPTFEKREKRYIQPIDKTPQDRFDRIYRSQGLVGKFFDKINGFLGVGLSKKKLQKEILRDDSAKIDEKLDKYYDQQKNTTELTIDLLTGGLAAGAFRLAKKINTYSHLYIKNAKFEKASLLVGLGLSAVTGLIVKPILKGINNIGVKKEDRKRERTVFKDMATGLLDGAVAPLAYAHKLGVLGAVGINSLQRYAFNKKADKNSDFVDHLSNSWVAKGTAIGLAGLSVAKFHKRIDVLEKAIVKSKKNVENIEVFKTKMPLSELIDLSKTHLQDTKTQKDLIETTRKGFFSKFYLAISKPFRKNAANVDRVRKRDIAELCVKPLKRIGFENKHLIKEKEMMNVMREIEQYNIFYPKMIQTLPSNLKALTGMLVGDGKNLKNLFGTAEEIAKEKNWFVRKFKKFGYNHAEYITNEGINSISEMLNKYKSACPASRTMKEAQAHISDTFGKKYVLQGKAPIGVGTIAESYLAKDTQTGEEVVIKVVKKWANKEKLDGDKAKMLDALARVKDKMKPDEYDYQVKLVDELYKAWSKELDLGLEADAAKILGKYAKNYNTVAPIDVKNNIFVMQKANGVQFDKFADYLEQNNIKLTPDEATDLLRKYMEVFFEQLLSVPKKGEKVLHADPHAGNIFIDLKNKTKPFTFIDTGNVMRFTPEEAIQNVASHVDYLIGNSKVISQRLLKGAILPDGMSEKQAIELLSKHLDETFFSGKYKISTSDPFSAINNESMEFMKKNKVILNSNNTNMIKAELTYLMNMVSIAKISKNVDWQKGINGDQQAENMKMMFVQILESIFNGAINNKNVTYRELSGRLKFMRDNPEQFFTTLYTYLKPDTFKAHN